MANLLGFLIYILLLIAVIWNFAALWQSPSQRTLPRIAFVAIVGFGLLAMLFIGITQ